MKYIIVILFLFCFSGRLYAQDVLEVSFETDLRVEGGDRFVEIDIYFTPTWDWSEHVNAFELRMDINDKFFNAAPTESGNNDFSFYTYATEWSDVTYWPKPYANLVYIPPYPIMQISRMSTSASQKFLNKARKDANSPLVLKDGVPYKFGHISWKLLPSATGTLEMRIREKEVENGAVCSAASDESNTALPLQFVGDNIKRDATGA
ncbi:MAG: hypothetical protein K2I90_02545, partial [Odoribacter sp.]|nr:hypothetical protein [Odoribacter sp.]